MRARNMARWVVVLGTVLMALAFAAPARAAILS